MYLASIFYNSTNSSSIQSFGPWWPEVVKKEQGGRPTREPTALVLLCHQCGEFPQDLRHLPPQLFIVPPQAVYFLRVHPVGVGVNRHLIEIVGTAALQGHQLLDRGKVYMENVAVERHLPHIGPGVGDTGLGHPHMDGGQLVLRDHHMKMDIPLAARHYRSSSRPFRRSFGSLTLSNGFLSSSGGSGGRGVLFGTPSIMFWFCSVESSAVFR